MGQISDKGPCEDSASKTGDSWTLTGMQTNAFDELSPPALYVAEKIYFFCFWYLQITFQIKLDPHYKRALRYSLQEAKRVKGEET